MTRPWWALSRGLPFFRSWHPVIWCWTLITTTHVMEATPDHTFHDHRLHHVITCMHKWRDWWCHEESFGFSAFKMFYLLNKKAHWKTIFTIKSVATKASKLDPISMCFNDFFGLKVAMSIAHNCHGLYIEVAMICFNYFFFYV